MNQERFGRLKEILLQALDLPEGERATLLDRECGSDPGLRREVEELLAHEPPAEHGTAGLLRIASLGEAETLEEAAPAALVGRAISHYHITGLLGEGGMGLVYRAEDTALVRPVALKFLRAGAVGPGESWARFLREARAAAALDHPNICTVYAIEEFEGRLFIAMALIEGETLKARIRRGPLSPDEALGIVTQVALGLEAAHAKGIVHRDIKPTNIMISTGGRAQILDFGLARPSGGSEMTRSGVILGTVAYMSPEQARGGTLDARTDLWSLGAVLFEMLTGRRPFLGDQDTAVLYSIVNEDPPEVRDLRPGVPRGFSGILARLLARSKDERYPSAGELLRDLERIRNDPGGSISRTRRTARRRHFRRRLARIAGTVLLLAAAAGVAVWAGRRSAHAPMPQVQHRPVTSGSGLDSEPAISPDGSRIAYVSRPHRNGVIAVIDVGGGNPIFLTQDSSSSDSPCWFPDGSRVAFISDRAGAFGIWQVGQYGGGATPLIPHAWDPAISPDGARIAFARVTASGFPRVFVAGVASPADSVALTHDDDGLWGHRHPAWSPDGRVICYETAQGLWVVPSRGGAARRLTTKGSTDLEPAWSPSGRYVYFTSLRGGTRALWRISSQDGEPGRLTLGTGPEVHPSVSRDGSRLAYSTQRARLTLLLRDRRSGTENPLNDLGNAIHPAISPDGSRLVFVSHRMGENSDLWLQSLREGTPDGPPQRLNGQPGNSSQPVFSPDGNWIAYYGILGDQRDIYVLPIAGGDPIRVTEDPGSDFQPGWSPDGGSLAFSSDRTGLNQIWIVPTRDGRPAGPETLLATPGIAAYAPAWSPDGREIAFVGGRGEERDAWVVAADGAGPARRLTTGMVVMRLRWERGARRILASSWSPQSLLYSVPLDGAKPERVAPVVDFGPGEEAGFFDLSPDDRWLVYVRDDGPQGNVWVLDARPGSL